MDKDEVQFKEQEVSLAGDAKLLLDNVLFKESFDAIQADLMQQWKDSGAEQKELREMVHLAMKITDKVKKSLELTVETGKLASISLLELETAKTRHFKEQ